MMLRFCLLFVLLAVHAGAYTQVLNGKVILGPLASDPPLGNVRIDVPGMSPAISDPETGLFSLSLPGVQVGEYIPLTINLKGYAVINQKALKPPMPRNARDQILIHMAPAAQRDEMAVTYYQINIERVVKDNYQEKVNEAIAKGFGQLNIDTLNKLTAQRDAALAQAERMAEALAKVDLSQAAEWYQRAFAFFPDQIDSVLFILDEDLLDAELQKAEELEAQAQASKAQTIEGYMLRAQALVIEGKFVDAQRCYQKAVDADRTNVNNLWAFAYYLAEQNQDSLSLGWYQMALKQVNDSSTKANLLNNLGLVYDDLNRYEEAIATYQEALKIRRPLAKQNPQRFQPDLAQTLNNLGVVYDDLTRYEEAIATYQEALKIRRPLAKQNPQRFQPDLAHTLNNLGLVYDDLTRYEKAIATYQEALKIYRPLAKQNPQRFQPDLAQTLNNLGNIYYDLTRYEKAIATYQEVLKIYRPLAKQNPQRFQPDLANTLNNLGVVYQKLTRYEKAIATYQEALKIRRPLAKQNPQRFQPDLANTLNNLGVVYQKLTRYEEAIATYQEALKIYRPLAKQNPQRFQPDLANTLNNLGVVYDDLTRYEEAIATYQEALKIRNKVAKANPSVFGAALGDSYYTLANVYRTQFQFPKAIQYFTQADSAYQLSRGSLHAQKWGGYTQYWIAKLSEIDALPSALDDRGMGFLQAQQLDSAQQYIARAVRLYQAIPDDSLTLLVRYNASFAYEHLNRFESTPTQQYNNQQQVVRYREAVYQAYSSDTTIRASLASAHYNLSWYALFVEQAEEAEASARRTLALSPASIGVISNLATALLLQGKYHEAKKYYQEYADQPWPDDRYEIFREVFMSDLQALEEAGITHPDIKRIREFLHP
ncbi:MAG: tetratricopeptide repeat protein [Bacteroidota bacterium]